MPSGDHVCNFNVATSRVFTTRDGDRREETTWFRVAVWGRQAENCAKYLSKGRQVLVVGRVSASAFIGREGDARASLEVNAISVQFLAGRADEDGRAGVGAGRAGAYTSPAGDGGSRMEGQEISGGGEAPRASDATLDDEDDGDIPF